jgi:hypothetical protein
MKIGQPDAGMGQGIEMRDSYFRAESAKAGDAHVINQR